MVIKSSSFFSIHILILRSLVSGSRFQAEAWHTTFLSTGLINSERSQKESGRDSNPIDKKNSSASSTIFFSLISLSLIIWVTSTELELDSV